VTSVLVLPLYDEKRGCLNKFSEVLVNGEEIDLDLFSTKLKDFFFLLLANMCVF
jgi:hypothetical protein